MEIIKGFIKTYLNVEMAFGYLPAVRSTVGSFSPEWGASLRSEFEQLLAEQSMSAADYCGLTWVEFESDRALYEYLGKVYSYLFSGGEEIPVPPEN